MESFTLTATKDITVLNVSSDYETMKKVAGVSELNKENLKKTSAIKPLMENVENLNNPYKAEVTAFMDDIPNNMNQVENVVESNPSVVINPVNNLTIDQNNVAPEVNSTSLENVAPMPSLEANAVPSTDTMNSNQVLEASSDNVLHDEPLSLNDEIRPVEDQNILDSTIPSVPEVNEETIDMNSQEPKLELDLNTVEKAQDLETNNNQIVDNASEINIERSVVPSLEISTSENHESLGESVMSNDNPVIESGLNVNENKVVNESNNNQELLNEIQELKEKAISIGKSIDEFVDRLNNLESKLSNKESEKIETPTIPDNVFNLSDYQQPLAM